MILYGLKTCDTCRKAMKTLDNVTFQDVRESPIGAELLNRALSQFGDALVNRRSTTWRQLDDAQRKREPVALLTEYPTLMKRPLIDDGTSLWLGWGPDVQKALGKAA